MDRFAFLILVSVVAQLVPAAEPDARDSPAARGYRFLVEKAYLSPDFDGETFAAAWKQWPEPLRSQAEQATAEERRTMAFTRYGLTPRPDDPAKPLQYAVDAAGTWTMNCFACHGGTIPECPPSVGNALRGVPGVWPGSPNSRLALQTLTEETRLAKAKLQKPFSRMDLGSAVVPLGTTNGTTNAVMFGVLLMAYRDADLTLHKERPIPPMVHHDMDAPPWWHLKRKKMMYIDGFAAKSARGLMQFMLIPQNGPEKFREWEHDFEDVLAYIESIEPPKYPFAIDRALSERGRAAFNRVCADCHGTYGAGGAYPEKMVPIEEVGTDRVRLDALSATHRDAYGQSWFAHFGNLPNITQPPGYIAPPLDGIWATGPYFHNGSVPTLWHVLHPKARPIVWTRAGEMFDPDRLGPAIEVSDDLPSSITAGWQRRQYFDTRGFGKSAAGHDFADVLNEDERLAVLEYLKTL
ncbi:MAG TPA: cytochrome c [Pirellulaceae bacterium]|jgi:mono/diheme cytochrome c family protein